MTEFSKLSVDLGYRKVDRVSAVGRWMAVQSTNLYLFILENMTGIFSES